MIRMVVPCSLESMEISASMSSARVRMISIPNLRTDVMSS